MFSIRVARAVKASGLGCHLINCAYPDVGNSLIAALAWRMKATVVTRNPADFEAFGVPVLGYGESQASAGTKRGSTS